MAIAALLIGGMVYSMILQRVLGSVPWGSSAADATAIRTGVPRLDRIIEEQRRDIATLSSEMSLSEASRGDIIRRHAMLTDNLAAAVIIRDGQNRITYCSPYTEVLTGYARSEIVGSHEDFMLSIMHEDDHERYHRAMQMVFQSAKRTSIECAFATRAALNCGSKHASVPIASRGSADASLSIALDVTATVHYQHQVEEKNRDLRDFTYMVSHDLKAPSPR
ncbi:MAG: PAS domain-containing protein [Bdellovibrionota bacterium]|nr:MAG: PAS domain-containing protein [Bdellovibrionota bacterium]